MHHTRGPQNNDNLLWSRSVAKGFASLNIREKRLNFFKTARTPLGTRKQPSLSSGVLKIFAKKCVIPVEKKNNRIKLKLSV